MNMDDFVLESIDGNKHASALVAPLNIQKSPKKSANTESRHTRQSSSHGTASIASQPHSHSQSQPSPPLTPRTSKESLPEAQIEAQAEAPTAFQPVFHDYLRAFYHYHPTSTVSSSTDESSITVPINQGDVILVHSVHPNGWADGTLLASGARGWLPTNYCEAYDHPTIRNLLNALTHLFDLVRDAENGEFAVFTKQDYVRSMIAGVRCFLERTQCLTRDSPLIVAHVGLRRMRKGLLGDLSSLVKTAKKLQETVQAEDPSLPIFDLLDELVLKAFKLVTRAVRFLDIWAQDSVSITLDLADTRTNRPPTPPSDSVDPSVQPPSAAEDPHRGASSNDYAAPAAQADVEDQDSSTSLPQRNLNRLSVAFSIPSEPDSVQSPLLPPQPQGQAKRWSVTHRLSYTAKSQGARKQNLASERLNAAHDAFLGFIGSFIGLHLQSRSSDELTHTTKQSVIACRQLLAVVEEVWERDSRRSEQLEEARDTMYARLTELVQATKDMFSTTDAATGEEVVMPDSGKQLVAAATGCVRSAGDCVTKARNVIERIGDFEFEQAGLGLSETVMEQFGQIVEKYAEPPGPEPAATQPEPAVEKDKPLPAPPSDARQPPPLIVADSKPLPDVPLPSPLPNTPASIEPQTTQTTVESPTAASFRLSRSSITPVPQLTQPSPSDYSQSPASATQRFFSKSFGADSVNASVTTDSSSTYRYSIRCDTGSVASQPSTRATTPDQSPAKMHSSQTLVSSLGSSSELRSLASDEVAAVEEHLLGKTFAHELIYNKEGQISGGSLPALVEQLTMPDSTPDSTFVTTFFLTFRLFTTPVELAECLIARFDYVGESASVGTPVRLRIYNVFKGWLESHWLPDSDSVALGVIISFATNKLRAALPNAGKRLAELTAKVTEVHAGALVPRLASSIGKGGAYTAFTTADSNVPAPIVTKGQLALLRNAKDGKSQCSILDFDPLELARQFTIIESKLFCAIQPEELLASEWTKKNGSKAVNVRAMSTLSTDLANLVTDTILSLEDPKKRAITIKQWVKIAQKCLELNNYDSLMAIICSLNSSMVLRLLRTWELVSAKTKARLDELKTITDVGRNYAVLRQRLQNHMAPCIPFVGIYLTDLTFVDVGNGSTRQLPSEDGREGASVINFDKHMKTAKIIGQLQSFQVPYRLAAVPEMQDWMDAQIQRVRASDQANVQSYYRRSLFLEPRENAVKAPQPPADGGATITGSSRNSSKERFDFLNFTFVPASAPKDR